MTKLQLQVSTDHSLSQTSVLKYGPNFRLQILTEYWPNPSLEILNNHQCQNLYKSVANTTLITNISNNNNTNKYWVGIFTIQGWQSSLNNISEWVSELLTREANDLTRLRLESERERDPVLLEEFQELWRLHPVEPSCIKKLRSHQTRSRSLRYDTSAHFQDNSAKFWGS